MFTRKQATATVEPETMSSPDPAEFLTQARTKADECVRLRARLFAVQQEHGQLLRRREYLLSQGADLDAEGVPQKLGKLWMEITKLPKDIAQLEAEIRAAMIAGLSSLENTNHHESLERVRALRADLRDAIKALRKAWAAAHDGAAECRTAPISWNESIGQIECTLGGAPLPRISVFEGGIPWNIDPNLASRSGFIAALDALLAQLASW